MVEAAVALKGGPTTNDRRLPMRPLGILIVLCTVLAGTTARSEEFRSSDLLAAHSPTAQAVAYMGKVIHERTGGRHSIRVLAQLTTSTDNYTVEQVRSGAVAMARVRLASFHTSVPATVVPSLPFLFKSTAHMRRSLDGSIGDEILTAMESVGLIGLCFYDTGPRSFYSSNKPIRNVSDLKGMKVRVQSTDILGDLLRTIGAIPRPIPLGMVYNSLKSDAVDAAEFDLLTYENLRHYEVAKFYSVTEHSMAPSVLVFSKKIWDRLSKEDQIIIGIAAKESVPYMRKLWDEYEPTARKAVEAAGAQINTDTDKKSFSDALVPGYAKFVTDPNLKNMVEKIKVSDLASALR